MSEYASIPEPQASIESLFETVSALKQTVEALVGRRGTDVSTAVTRADLVAQSNLAGATPSVALTNLGLVDVTASWANFTPTITATTGVFTSVSANGQYKVIGKIVLFRLQIVITTIGTAAGRMLVPLPTGTISGGTPTNDYCLLCSGLNQGTHKGVFGQIYDSLTQISVNLYDASFPGTSGEAVNIAGFYEQA